MPVRNKTDNEPDKAGYGPSLLRTLGRSPAALAGYLGLHQGLAGGRLTTAERCLIGLMVAQRSGSPYWLSVQGRLAQKAGLTKDEISAAREKPAVRRRIPVR